MVPSPSPSRLPVAQDVDDDVRLPDLAGEPLPLNFSYQLSKLLSLPRRLPVWEVPPLPPLSNPNARPILSMMPISLAAWSPSALFHWPCVSSRSGMTSVSKGGKLVSTLPRRWERFSLALNSLRQDWHIVVV